MNAELEGQQKAATFRHDNDLGMSPIRDVQELIEGLLGIDVAVMTMPGDLDAVMRRDPESGRVLIGVGTSRSPERQRFTTAHELGHVLFGEFRDEVANGLHRDAAEQRADSFARHLLAPQQGVRRLVEKIPDELTMFAKISAIVRHFGVSPYVAAIQLRDIEVLTVEEFDAVKAKPASWYARRFGWAAERESLVVDALREQAPQRITTNAIEAYLLGQLSLRQLARVHGVNDVDEFERELVGEGIVPPTAADPHSEVSFGDEW
ncbi:ImmA/IrrE family metallo-endopeptidase [Leucobacter sp. HY1910]